MNCWDDDFTEVQDVPDWVSLPLLALIVTSFFGAIVAVWMAFHGGRL